MPLDIVGGSREETVDRVGHVAEESARAELEFSQGTDIERRDAEARIDLVGRQLDGLDLTAREAIEELRNEVDRLEKSDVIDEYDLATVGYDPDRVRDLVTGLEEALLTYTTVETVLAQEDHDRGYFQ